jgi:hypothetical protein
MKTMKTSEWPKGFVYVPIYEPDEKKMVEALKILLNSSPADQMNQDSVRNSLKKGAK